MFLPLGQLHVLKLEEEGGVEGGIAGTYFLLYEMPLSQETRNKSPSLLLPRKNLIGLINKTRALVQLHWSHFSTIEHQNTHMLPSERCKLDYFLSFSYFERCGCLIKVI